MMWTGRADEAAALGLLLDRTYAEVAAAAEHPRGLDREFLIGQFDLWDNHLLPAVAAGTAPPWVRRPAARAVWRRLGWVAGAVHRHWMADHLDGLELDPVALLGPGQDHGRPFRSRDGRLQPAAQPVTDGSAELIRADYDLAGGAFEGARMEAHGPESSQIRGFLKLSAAGRRYPAAATEPPELHFRFGTATAFGFPHAERGSVRLSAQPAVEVTPDGATLDVPASGMDLRLAARDLTWYPHDSTWHESAGARAADEGVHETGPELHPPAGPAGPAGTLQMLQLLIMRQLRMMRHTWLLRRWELAAAGSLCQGLNAELFRIRPAALRSRAATHRLRAMLETDDPLSRAFLRHVGRDLLLDVPGPPTPTPPRATPPGPPPTTPGPTDPGPAAGSAGPGSASAGSASAGSASAGSASAGSASAGSASAGPAGTGPAGTGSAGAGSADAGSAGAGSASAGSAGAGSASAGAAGVRLPGAMPLSALPSGVPFPVRITVGTAGPLFDALDFTTARLRLVDVVPHRTVLHLDARRAGRDTIVVLVLDEPLGCAPLTVTPAAGLSLARRPTLAATADDITLTIPLPGGDWTLQAAAGSCYVD